MAKNLFNDPRIPKNVDDKTKRAMVAALAGEQANKPSSYMQMGKMMQARPLDNFVAHELTPGEKALIDFSVMLGKGIYSVGEDIVFGLKRTGIGLVNCRNNNKMNKMGQENIDLANVIMECIGSIGVIPLPQHPIYKAVQVIITMHYALFPQDAIAILEKIEENIEKNIHNENNQKFRTEIIFPKKLDSRSKEKVTENFTKISSNVAGRFVGRSIGTKLVAKVSQRIAIKIISSTTFQTFASKIKFAIGSPTTKICSAAITAGILGLMANGIAQRASSASKRLQAEAPDLHKELLLAGGLHMIYFLLEKPMKSHIDAIKFAENNPTKFQENIFKLYGLRR